MGVMEYLSIHRVCLSNLSVKHVHLVNVPRVKAWHRERIIYSFFYSLCFPFYQLHFADAEIKFEIPERQLSCSVFVSFFYDSLLYTYKPFKCKHSFLFQIHCVVYNVTMMPILLFYLLWYMCLYNATLVSKNVTLKKWWCFFFQRGAGTD